MSLNAGELRNQIQIINSTGVRDSYGAEVETSQIICTVWAAIEPLTGRELWTAKQLFNTISTRIRIRYRVGIIPKMYIKHGPRWFHIESVIDVDNRHRELQLLCNEVVEPWI